VAPSYGERGESGDLWNETDQTIENVKRGSGTSRLRRPPG
jgi:hypothetical protein